MTTENATPTTYTPEQRLQALEDMKSLTTRRDAEPAIDLSGRRKALNEQILEQAKIAYAPEPDAAPAGPSWRERVQVRADRQALDAELMRHPQGSPEAKAIIQDKIALETEWASKQPPSPTPGAYGWPDYRRSPSPQLLSDQHRHELEHRLKMAGVDPKDGTLVAYQILEARKAKVWDQPPAEYDEPTRAAAERALAVLFPDAETREDLAAEGLWNLGAEPLVAGLVELAGRLAKR